MRTYILVNEHATTSFFYFYLHIWLVAWGKYNIWAEIWNKDLECHYKVQWENNFIWLKYGLNLNQLFRYLFFFFFFGNLFNLNQIILLFSIISGTLPF